MEAVGYDLYCKMLGEAVKELKGGEVEEIYTTTMDVNVDAYIPGSYIKNEYQKLDIYKRIAAIETEEEMDDMMEELIRKDVRYVLSCMSGRKLILRKSRGSLKDMETTLDSGRKSPPVSFMRKKERT